MKLRHHSGHWDKENHQWIEADSPPRYLKYLNNFVRGTLEGWDAVAVSLHATLRKEDRILNDIAQAVMDTGYEQDIYDGRAKLVKVYNPNLKWAEVGDFVVHYDIEDPSEVTVKFRRHNPDAVKTTRLSCMRCGNAVLHM